MLDGKQDVNGSGSSADEKIDSPSHRGTGGVNDRSIENVMAENQRKAEKISVLEEKISSYEDRLAELEEKTTLTRSEKIEKDELQDTVDSLWEQVKVTQNGKVWLHGTKKEFEPVINSKLLEDSTNRADWFLEDKAEELGMRDAGALAKEIAPFAAQHMRLLPERRNQLAFRDWQRAKNKQAELSKKEQDILKKEEEMKAYAEGRGRVSRDPSFKEKFNSGDKDQKLSMLDELIEQGSK